MERENNNTVIAVVITILVMIILGFVVYIAYDKFLINDNNEPNVEENNNKEENKVTYTDYDLDAAKKLVDKYAGSNLPYSSEPYFFTGELTDGEKIDIVARNMQTVQFTKVSCKSLFGEEYYEFEKPCGACDGYTAAISYSYINQLYQQMFGLDSNAPKIGFGFNEAVYDLINNSFQQYYKFGLYGVQYHKETNQFVGYMMNCGGEARYYDDKYMYEIATARVDNNQNLTIEVSAIGFDPIVDDDYNVLEYQSTYDSAITYKKLSDISDDYIKENPDKVHKIIFMFKKENENYYLDSLTKEK